MGVETESGRQPGDASTFELELGSGALRAGMLKDAGRTLAAAEKCAPGRSLVQRVPDPTSVWGLGIVALTVLAGGMYMGVNNLRIRPAQLYLLILAAIGAFLMLWLLSLVQSRPVDEAIVRMQLRSSSRGGVQQVVQSPGKATSTVEAAFREAVNGEMVMRDGAMLPGMGGEWHENGQAVVATELVFEEDSGRDMLKVEDEPLATFDSKRGDALIDKITETIAGEETDCVVEVVVSPRRNQAAVQARLKSLILDDNQDWPLFGKIGNTILSEVPASDQVNPGSGLGEQKELDKVERADPAGQFDVNIRVMIRCPQDNVAEAQNTLDFIADQVSSTTTTSVDTAQAGQGRIAGVLEWIGVRDYDERAAKRVRSAEPVVRYSSPYYPLKFRSRGSRRSYAADRTEVFGLLLPSSPDKLTMEPGRQPPNGGPSARQQQYIAEPDDDASPEGDSMEEADGRPESAYRR